MERLAWQRSTKRTGYRSWDQETAGPGELSALGPRARWHRESNGPEKEKLPSASCQNCEPPAWRYWPPSAGELSPAARKQQRRPALAGLRPSSVPRLVGERKSGSLQLSGDTQGNQSVEK